MQNDNNIKSAKHKSSMCQLRLTRDLQEYNQHKLSFVKLIFPQQQILNVIRIIITPQQISPYYGGTIPFQLVFPNGYPIDAPKLKCLVKIYHPNINLTGAVCLPLLREDWQPTVTLFSIVCGLIYILNNPDGDDPLNIEAGHVLKQQPQMFKKVVQYTMKGCTIKNQQYDCIIKKQ